MLSRFIAFGMLVGLAGCPALVDVPCSSNADCDLATGGQCLAAASGQSWCAFPDSSCDSGLRYSNDNVGDGVGGTCSGSGSGSATPPGKAALTVTIAGSGGGSVTSSPPGISCSAGTCSAIFDAGTAVTLTQTASAGAFLGWASACTGTDACTVTLAADAKVGAMFGLKGEVLWAKPITSTEAFEWGHGTVATKDGDVVATGQYLGVMMLDTVTLQSDSDSVTSGYVAKLDGLTGKAIWGKSFPVETANMIATDGDAFYVIGRYTGTIQLGTSVLTGLGLDDVYAMKLNAVGEVQWAMGVGGPGTDTPIGVTVTNGVVAFVGTEQNGITIGTTTTADSGASQTGFVVALDAGTGALKWSRVFTASGATGLTRTVYGGAHVLVGGGVTGTLDFGGGNVTPTGTTDAFVAQYDPATGALAKIDHWGNSGSNAYVTAVAEGIAGHLLAVGVFGGSLTLGSQTYTATATDAFVASFNGSTNLWYNRWAATASGVNPTIVAPATISVGINDFSIAGVFCNGTLYVNTTTLTGVGCTAQNGFRTGLVVRMKDDGTSYVSVHSFGPIGWSDTVSRAADDRSFMTGKYATALSIDTGAPLLQTTGTDGYVVAFAP